MNIEYLKNVNTLTLDPEKCHGCGRCAEVCPHNVFKLAEGKAIIQHKDRCMECGACARNCPFEAITVRTGVGCANAILKGQIGRTSPCCGPSDSGKSCCCG